jgi:NAD(P)-dependent dehydrogenase (short-subunit alcohol dehydrogenase family)
LFGAFPSHLEIFDLRGKAAAVTGSGLGRVFASVLAAYGADVLCIDRDASSTHQTANAILAAGGKATAHQIDVQNETSVRDFARAAVPIDILVNNAGIANAPKRVHEMDD